MKTDTKVMVFTAMVLIYGQTAINLATSLAQWANTHEWPDGINWMVILLGASGSACMSYVTFKNKTFADWQASRKNGVDNPPPAALPPKP